MLLRPRTSQTLAQHLFSIYTLSRLHETQDIEQVGTKSQSFLQALPYRSSGQRRHRQATPSSSCACFFQYCNWHCIAAPDGPCILKKPSLENGDCFGTSRVGLSPRNEAEATACRRAATRADRPSPPRPRAGAPRQSVDSVWRGWLKASGCKNKQW